MRTKEEILTIGDKNYFAQAIEHLKKSDPKLSEVIERHGTLEFAPEGELFQSLVESILSQQLAWAAASAIIRRVKALYPRGIITPKLLYKTPPSKLRKAGVSPQKLRYLRDLSKRVVRRRLDLKRLKTATDINLLEALDDVLGIGPWTVHMLLIFTLGRPDVLPVDDLGIRKAIQEIYSLESLPKKQEIEGIAKNWHPYCSVAALYLWRHKDSA